MVEAFDEEEGEEAEEDKFLDGRWKLLREDVKPIIAKFVRIVEVQYSWFRHAFGFWIQRRVVVSNVASSLH